MLNPVTLSIRSLVVAFGSAGALLLGSAANAAFDPPNVDLANPNGYVYPQSSGTNSTYNGGAINVTGQADSWFQADSTQPAGTGVFNPFLRVQVTGSGTPKNASEQGYNTSFKNANTIFDNKAPTNWTHDVKFSDLEVVTRNGVDFYQFKLDINEPGVAPDSLLSLDGLKLFSTNTPSQSSTTVDSFGDWLPDPAAGNKLLWDLDKGKDPNFKSTGNNPYDLNDRYILLDGNRNGGGSGIADMVVFFNKAQIDAARGTDTNLILWSRFGINQGAWDSGNTADGGFEEWSFAAKTSNGNCTGTSCGGGGVPLPNSLWLLALGLGALWVRASRRQSLAVPAMA